MSQEESSAPFGKGSMMFNDYNYNLFNQKVLLEANRVLEIIPDKPEDDEKEKESSAQESSSVSDAQNKIFLFTANEIEDIKQKQNLDLFDDIRHLKVSKNVKQVSLVNFKYSP